MFADGAGGFDERGEPAALRPRTPAVDQLADLVVGEVASEDGPQGLLQSVGAPQGPSMSSDDGERRGLAVGEVLGVLPPMAMSP